MQGFAVIVRDRKVLLSSVRVLLRVLIENKLISKLAICEWKWFQDMIFLVKLFKFKFEYFTVGEHILWINFQYG